MGRDIVASAKEFEDHAQKGYRPESLASELHNMSGADRLAVAKQIDWDMKHQSNPSLPKIDFYDSGDLKSVETVSKSAVSNVTEHTELDKVSGKTKFEVKNTDTTLSSEHTTRIELEERDSNGHVTHRFDSNTTLNGTTVKIENDDERWSYDTRTGNKVTHDEQTTSGKQLHEEFDGTTGKQKLADEITNRGNSHRVYDSTTGNLQREDITNADKTHETIKYNSNGDKTSREKQYGNNGDAGTREWVYSPRTGQEVYSEFRYPDGKITKNNINENGKWTPVEE